MVAERCAAGSSPARRAQAESTGADCANGDATAAEDDDDDALIAGQSIIVGKKSG